MKKIISILLLLFVSTFYTLNSQTSYGLRIAIGSTNVTTDKDDIGSKFGTQFGFTINENFNSWFSLQSEVLYSTKGSISSDNPPVEYNFVYIDFPVLAKFKVSNLFNNSSLINLNFGLYYSTKLTGELKQGNDVYDANGLNSYDLGLIFGTEFLILRKMSLDFRYNLGIVDITSITNKNKSYMIGLSYFFN
jgi:hypothetical protein